MGVPPQYVCCGTALRLLSSSVPWHITSGGAAVTVSFFSTLCAPCSSYDSIA